jgi:dTDP-4-dehydrorhamnose 3,5-epimerase
MILTECELPGAFIVDIAAVSDERGFFARTYCAETFAARGVRTAMNQCSVSYNARKATLRGMHFQRAPHAEDKLVRCSAGSVFDVIVDLREQSPTYRRWFGVELSADNRRALFVPQGFAHGFITLADATEVFYMISAPYVPGAAGGLRWDDPAIGIAWPLEPAVMSARDAAYALLGPAAAG